MSLTSSSLMCRLQNQSDDGAWLRLCQAYRPLLQNWMRRLQIQAADVEDLVQNVLVVVCQKFPDFQHNGRPGAFRTWLRIIVALQSREYMRKLCRGAGRGANESDPIFDSLEDSGSDLSKRWDQEHDQFVIRQTLSQIENDFTPAVWQIFRLLTFEELAPQEVAKRTGATIQAIYASKARVLARLREELKGWVEL